mgnify:CR=1 FL=1
MLTAHVVGKLLSESFLFTFLDHDGANAQHSPSSMTLSPLCQALLVTLEWLRLRNPAATACARFWSVSTARA